MSMMFFVSCKENSSITPTPEKPPQMSLSESTLTLELCGSKSINVRNAPEAITVDALDGVSTQVSGTTVRISLEKPLANPAKLIIRSGKQQVELTLTMAQPRAIDAPFGVFRGNAALFNVVYYSKKLNPQTGKLEYYVMSNQRVRPLDAAHPLLRAMKLSALTISEDKATFKLKAFGNFVGGDNQPLFKIAEEQTLTGAVLFSSEKKTQVRVKLSENQFYDFVFPNQ